MNRSKKLCILLGVLAVACAAALGAMRLEERREQVKISGEVILDVPPESVQSLAWDCGETSLAFHKDETWRYDGDPDFPVSEEQINRLLEPFRALGAAFRIEAVEDYGQYGLDDPRLTISIDYTAEDGEEDTFRLLVSPDPEAVQAAGEGADSGRDGEIPAYIRVGESQIVYKISPGGYEALTAVSFDDLRHAEVIWADFSDVRQMDIALEGAVYTLTAEPDGGGRIWRYQAEEVEIAGVQDSLEALTAIEFTDEQPSQKEEISLTVYLEESPSDIQIALYRYDGDRCIAVVDGESVSFVDRAAVVSLIEAVYAIVLR